MALRIVDIVRPRSPDGLTPLQLEQLRIAGRAYDGVDRAPELRFVDVPGEQPDDDVYGNLAALGFLSVSRILEGDEHRYDLWVLDPDAAALFSAGTTELVASRCQSTWMTPDLMDASPHAPALDEAMHAATLW